MGASKRRGSLRLDQLIGQLYDATLDPKGWLAAAEELERCLGGVVVLSLPHPRPGDPGRVVTASIAHRFIESYKHDYFMVDPFQHSRDHASAGILEFGRESVADEQVESSRFFREWMQPQGLLSHPFLGALIECDDLMGNAYLAVFRSRDQPCFGAAERRLGQQLMPHLRRAMQIYFRNARLEQELQAHASVLDHWPTGLVLIDRRGHIHSMNQTAERLVGENDGLSIGREGLRTASAPTTHALQQLLSDASGSIEGAAPWRPVGLLLPRPSGHRALEVVVTRIYQPGESGGGRRGMLALFVSDPEVEMETPFELLRCLYSLTPSEAALARELSSGRNLEQGAANLGITPGTARQRLGQIFAKTGTTRQAALVRLLLVGSAQLRWPRNETEAGDWHTALRAPFAQSATATLGSIGVHGAARKMQPVAAYFREEFRGGLSRTPICL